MRTETTRFMYHCAQTVSRQHKPKKAQRDGAKSRDKIAMDAFACKGWLHITVMDSDHLAYIQIKHLDDHIPYYSIDVPPKIIEFVHENHNLTSVKVS
jgi:hypothetical protein